MRGLQLFVILLSCSLFAGPLACGDDDNGQDNGDLNINENGENGENGDSLERYDGVDDEMVGAVLLAERYCTMAWECPENGVFSLFESGRFSSKSECIDVQSGEAGFGDISPDLKAAFDEERVSLNREYLADCRADYLDAVCAPDFNFYDVLGWDDDHPCYQLFNTSADAGDLCTVGDECDGNRICDRSAAGEDTCYGECASPSEYGPHRCDDEVCDGDEYCNRSDWQNPFCEPHRSEGEECDGTVACELGLWCSIDDICSPIVIRNEGEACEIGHDFCEAGTSCFRDDLDEHTGECKPISDAGETCTESENCSYLLRCDIDEGESAGQCVTITASPGEPCEEHSQCESGYCDFSSTGDLVCAEFRDNGEECDNRLQCESGNCNSAGECAEYALCELPE